MGYFPFVPSPVTGAQITPPLELVGATAVTELIGGRVTGDSTDRVFIDAGQIAFGNGSDGQAANLVYGGGGKLDVGSATLDITTTGKGLAVAEGANAKQGTFVLSGGATTVVANTSVTASSRIFLTCQALGTVAIASTLAVSAVSVGVSFTVTPSVATDTSTIAYEIFEPG